MKNLNYSNINLLISGILEKNAREIPHLPAVISDNDILSHLELYNRVHNTISTLENLGILSGTNVALRFDDHIKHLVFLFALFKMNVPLISINPKDVLKQQQKAISVTNIEFVIQDIPIENKLLDKTLYISKDWNPSLKNRINKFQKVINNDNNTTAIYLVGSGTTGEPKAFAVHSSALAFRLKYDVIPGQTQKGDRYYCYSEIYYSFSRNQVIRALIKGMTVFLPKSKPKCIISFCTEQQIDHIELVGSQGISLLLQEEKLKKISYPRLPKLKSLVLSSSLISEPLRQKILSKITSQLFIDYSTNEFGGISMANPKDISKHAGTVGQIYNEVELAIVDDNGNPCEIGETGNILVKSADMIRSYINNPEATKKTFTKEGYYPGDIGKLTEDGNLIYEGRKDDMMIISGANIYPRELESVLESHPMVIEAAAFPIYAKNYGAIPFAVVSVKSKIMEHELLRWCASELGWKRPKNIFFIKKLPRNSAGKVLKRLLVKEILKTMNTIEKGK